MNEYAHTGWLVIGTSLAILVLSSPVQAQQANDNALRKADDAFGVSLAHERVGIYTPDEVRGFSAVVAGNLRIQGMYFDQEDDPNPRLIENVTMRVGLTAQGYSFPAPTGVAEYQLRLPGPRTTINVGTGLHDNFSPYLEVEAKVPLAGDRLGVAAGINYRSEKDADGADGRYLTQAVTLAWRPSPGVELVPFWSRTDVYDLKSPPLIFVAGHFLPPPIPRGRFFGQPWANQRIHSSNAGLVAAVGLQSDWTLRAGLFRSSKAVDREFVDLFRDTSADGFAHHVIIADPPKEASSWSGEARLSRTIAEGPRRHIIDLAVRGRYRQSRFGGSDAVDLGNAQVGVISPISKPELVFGPQTTDRVRQWTVGAAYRGTWRDIGEISFGIQKTHYQKTIDQPGKAPARTTDAPWLFNAGLTFRVFGPLSVYGAYTRGLEETGVAPENAVNRGEAVPAARTSQREIGFRYAFSPRLNLVAGLFDIRKPYFNLDADNVFTGLGQVKNRGVELSLTGNLTDRLTVVAGAFFIKPRVSGEAVALGRTGEKPLASTDERIRASFEYSVAKVEGLTLLFRVDHEGARIASRDNLLYLPQRNSFDLGTRYRFRLGQYPAQFRVMVENVADHPSWRVSNSGYFRQNNGRVLTAYFSWDL